MVDGLWEDLKDGLSGLALTQIELVLRGTGVSEGRVDEVR